MRLHRKLWLDYYVGGFLHAVLKPCVVVLGKILRRNHDLKSCSSVTLLKLMGGGSLIIAYPALLALKRAPGIRELRLVTTPAVQPFAEILKVFDEILIIRDDSIATLAADGCKAIARLFRCDVVIDLEPHSRLTTVFSLLTCARNRVGFFTTISFWRRNLATHLLFFNVTSPVYRFYDQIASLFSGHVEPFGECIHEFRAHFEMPACNSGRHQVAVAPCCSDLARTRMLLPAEWAIVVGRYLAARGGTGVDVHLFAAPGQQNEVESIRKQIQEKFPSAEVVNHAGRTSLQETLQLLTTAEVLIAIDSALLHCARLLGIRTISYWGPTAPDTLLRPSIPGHDTVHYEKLSCSPCVHLADRPPCNGNNICMRLSVEPDRSDSREPCWVVS